MPKARLAFFAFLGDESGAVTVDWVVLAAAVIGLGILAATTVGGGTNLLAFKTKTYLEAVQVGADDCPSGSYKTAWNGRQVCVE